MSEFNERDNEFVPSTTTTLDPFSEEYHQDLMKVLALAPPKYAHVDQGILHEFAQVSHCISTSGSPLGEINGFEHHIDTEDALPVYKHPYHKSPEERKTAHGQDENNSGK